MPNACGPHWPQAWSTHGTEGPPTSRTTRDVLARIGRACAHAESRHHHVRCQVDRNAVAYSDSDVERSDTDVKRFARVWQSAYDTVPPRNEGVVARVRARLI